MWALGYGLQGIGWAAVFLAPNLPAALACLVLMRLAGLVAVGVVTGLASAAVGAIWWAAAGRRSKRAYLGST